jgi:hypothetical protein
VPRTCVAQQRIIRSAIRWPRRLPPRPCRRIAAGWMPSRFGPAGVPYPGAAILLDPPQRLVPRDEARDVVALAARPFDPDVPSGRAGKAACSKGHGRMLLGHVCTRPSNNSVKTVLRLFCSDGAWGDLMGATARCESSRRSRRRNASNSITPRRHRLPAFDPINPNVNERPAVRRTCRCAPVRASRRFALPGLLQRHTPCACRIHAPNSRITFGHSAGHSQGWRFDCASPLRSDVIT